MRTLSIAVSPALSERLFLNVTNNLTGLGHCGSTNRTVDVSIFVFVVVVLLETRATHRHYLSHHHHHHHRRRRCCCWPEIRRLKPTIVSLSQELQHEPL